MKMWKKVVALVLGVMLMGTAVSAFAEDVMVAPIIDEAVEAVEEALGEEQDVKTLILNNLKQKMEHVGDALMSMKFDFDIDMALMGEAQAIKFNADLNAMSSGLDKVQIYGSAHMEMNGEAENAPLDGYLVKAEEGKYAMYLKADEGWTKQTIDIGSMVNDLDKTIKNVQNSDAFTIATEPERQADGLHFIAQIDVAKIMAQVDESELNELNEAASEMAPGMDVVELLKGMKPINVEIVCDDNYDPKSILIDAKDTIQTLADIVIEGFVNQMAASMAASDETTEGQQVDFNEFIKLKINSLVWNLYSLQLLPSGSVVIEVPEEALNAVEDETNGLIMDNDYDSYESYDVSNDGFGE